MTLEDILLCFYDERPYASLAKEAHPVYQYMALAHARWIVSDFINQLMARLDKVADRARDGSPLGHFVGNDLGKYQMILNQINAEIETLAPKVTHLDLSSTR